MKLVTHRFHDHDEMVIVLYLEVEADPLQLHKLTGTELTRTVANWNRAKRIIHQAWGATRGRLTSPSLMMFAERLQLPTCSGAMEIGERAWKGKAKDVIRWQGVAERWILRFFLRQASVHRSQGWGSRG